MRRPGRENAGGRLDAVHAAAASGPSGQHPVVLTICYGITIALLGSLGSSALTIVAVAGALVIGGLWAILGVFSTGKRS